MTRKVSSFCPETEAVDPNHEHRWESTWTDRSTSGVSAWNGVNEGRRRSWHRLPAHVCQDLRLPSNTVSYGRLLPQSSTVRETQHPRASVSSLIFPRFSESPKGYIMKILSDKNRGRNDP